MTKVYDREIYFQYPANWEMERTTSEGGWTVSLQSPGTAFLTITCDASMPLVEEMAEAVLGALREDYPDLEADPAVDTVAGQPAMGHDISFFSLDLTNTCWTRSFYTDLGTVLVLGQLSDIEREPYEMVLRAITRSMKVEE